MINKQDKLDESDFSVIAELLATEVKTCYDMPQALEYLEVLRKVNANHSYLLTSTVKIKEKFIV